MARWQPIDWMFLGYTVMWGAMVLYMGNLNRRQAAVQRDLEALEAALGEDGGREAPASDLTPAGGGSRAAR